jgi:uncharacterized membrane protein
MSVTSVGAKSVLVSKQLQLAVGGWLFFLAENFILSENRTALIDYLGDENYHLVYGTFSTVATGTIGYGYYRIAGIATGSTGSIPVSPLNRLTAWGFLSVGLILASQALPKMQIPVSVVSSSSASLSSSTKEGGGGLKVQVRCPFDFTDQKNAVNATHQIQGMERVTRHSGLWSFGLIGAGNAAIQMNPALKLWWYGPALVAWLGGTHSDSRFRRGMGGTLDPWYDSQTSNFPFAAMVSGKQGPPSQAFANLLQETKLLNAAFAVGMATLWVVSRGRAGKLV